MSIHNISNSYDILELYEPMKDILFEYRSHFEELTSYWNKTLKEKLNVKDVPFIELGLQQILASEISLKNGIIDEITPKHVVRFSGAMVKFPGVIPVSKTSDYITKEGFLTTINSASISSLRSINSVYGIYMNLPKKIMRNFSPVFIDEEFEETLSKPFRNVSIYSNKFRFPDEKELMEIANEINETIKDIDPEMYSDIQISTKKIENVRLNTLMDLTEPSIYQESYSRLSVIIAKKHEHFGYFKDVASWKTRGPVDVLIKDLDAMREEIENKVIGLKRYVDNVRSEHVPLPGTYSIITNSHTSYVLLHEVLMHNIEGINLLPNVTFQGLFLDYKMPVSTNIREQLGEKIFRNEPFSDIVLYDVPTLKKLPGYKHLVNPASYEKDYRGTIPKKSGTEIVRGNRLTGILTGMISASVLHKVGVLDSLKLTGNERVESLDYIPVSRMSTLIAKRATRSKLPSVEELFETEKENIFYIEGSEGGYINLSELSGEEMITKVYRYDKNKDELIPLSWASSSELNEKPRISMTLTYDSIMNGITSVADPKYSEVTFGSCGHPLTGYIPVTGYVPPMLLKNIQLVVRTN